MTVLTIGNSPFLLNRNGRINGTILKSLKAAGHKVGSIVWEHDIRHFLPSEVGVHTYNDIRLFPFLKQKGELASFSMEVMKSAQPNVIVSIGDYSELTFLAAIKAKYRSLFKWVAIVPLGGLPMNELYRYDLEMADAIICCNRQSTEHISEVVRADTYYCPFGPDLDVFRNTNELPDDFGVIYPCKNDQMSNPAAFLGAVKEANVRAGLHYNHCEEGAFDIPLLIKRLGIEKSVRLPQKFVSLREGLEDNLMNEEYNRYHAVVDCSSQSSTGLSMLEAMATGCIPVGIEYGAAGDIINSLPEEFRFFAPYETLTGPREEQHAVVSTKKLASVLKNIEAKCTDRNWLTAARLASSEAAQFFSKDKFANRVNDIIENVVFSEHAIIVDSF
jgi:glycosyltransferase involved in cell wall biosynthesis